MSIISKSNYLNGLKCPKLLWICINDKTKIPAPDELQQHIFDQGTMVGKLAQSLYPNGVAIQDRDIQKNLEQTKELLKTNDILFEAAFSTESIYARTDILIKNNNQTYDIIEVKSTSRVKDEQLKDVAFQRYCLEKSGLKISRCHILHISTDYVKKGQINLSKLFTREDVTDKLSLSEIPEEIESMLKVLSSKSCPKQKINENCHHPYECPMVKECWGFLPKNSVFNLYRIGSKSFELMEQGVYAIKDIHMDVQLTGHQDIQRQCEHSKKPHIDKAEIAKFLKPIKYPIHYLDFETFGTAVPIYDNTSPYQNIPFQFSLHLKKDKKSKLEHYSFLADGKQDPREKFIKALKESVQDEGSIIVYNMSFEKGILKALAEKFPRYRKWIGQLDNRIIDLIVPFRNFSYYNPKQEGSASLKAVLPAMTGKSYKGMEIAEGGTASLKFLYIAQGDINGKRATAKETEEIRHNLEIYCGLDTEAMAMIVDKLTKLTE